MKDIVITLSDGSLIQRGIVNTKFNNILVDAITFNINDHTIERSTLMNEYLNSVQDFIIISDLNKSANNIEDLIINKNQIVSVCFHEHITKKKTVL